MRIGIAGLSCECCTFSPLHSDATDFQVARGPELLERYGFLVGQQEVEAIPLLRARALPGGSITRSFYDQVKEEMLDAVVQAGPLDGLLLDMHGASHVVGLFDAEADLVASIRHAVGDRCLISASYDLHGNVSPALMEQIDLLTAYRTAPHVDVIETVERAWSMLVRCVRKGLKPVKAFVPIPILLSGEQTSTDWEPGASLYAAIPEVVEEYGILDASILVGYAWADEARSGASVVAFGFDQEAVNEAARDLAMRFWSVRREFDFGSPTGSVDECIRRALEPSDCPVVISDSGDNPTAGGAGDVPFTLERLLTLDVPDAVFASIVDSEAVEVCRQAGVGCEVDVSLGGRLDPLNGTPLDLRGTVVRYEAGTDGENANDIAVVESGGVQVIITQCRTPFHHVEDFRRLGIEPSEHAIVVVKIGYLVPELRQLAARSLIALSPGAVNQDLENLPFRRIRRPMYPFDPAMTWHPED